MGSNYWGGFAADAFFTRGERGNVKGHRDSRPAAAVFDDDGLCRSRVCDRDAAISPHVGLRRLSENRAPTAEKLNLARFPPYFR